MQKRIVQATATALLFATFAAPAFAHGNGKEKEKGNGFFGFGKSEKHESEDKNEKGDRGLHLGWFLHGSTGPSAEDKTCLADAKTAKQHAMTLAQDANRDAIAAAHNAYLSAVASATQTKASARLAARTTFLASDKSLAAWSAYLSARRSANSAWDLSVRAARATESSAKKAAQSVLDAARAKAIADLQAAEAACATTTPPPTTTDVTAPAAITSLSLSGVTSTSVILGWTAPGDDGSTGTAASYDVRYSTAAITAANFASATAVSGEPVPTAAGTAQNLTVTGLAPATTYFFAIRATDEASNVALISNVVSTTTLVAADTTAPSAVTDLSLSGVTSSSVILGWTAPGDDGSTGTAASYDVRYSTAAITAANFSSANAASGEPIPTAAGTAQNLTVTGLSGGTTYFFAIRATDESSNVAAISNVASIQTAP